MRLSIAFVFSSREPPSFYATTEEMYIDIIRGDKLVVDYAANVVGANSAGRDAC
jgi:hypothetical protein